MVGTRIKFVKQENLLVSARIYSNGDKMARLIIDTDKMVFYVTDPITGFVFEQGGNVTNREVLLRKAKRSLKKFLNIAFTKEKRNVRKQAQPGN